MRLQAIVSVSVMFHAYACDTGPAAPTSVDSAVISVLVKGNESDVKGSVYSKGSNVGTQTGNPYGEFLKSAQSQMGAAPTRVTVKTASLDLDETSSDGVDVLDDVFLGKVAVYFQAAGTAAIEAASVADPKGAGPVACALSQADLGPIQNRLLGGDFEVVLSGTSKLSDKDDFDLDTAVLLVFTAHR